ncbi:MAG: hypothetical protein HUU50_19220 [Candidatus Brocadiae bacterium]|nr:hypothetical protein [Candidatus Brocadiia bacterium]
MKNFLAFLLVFSLSVNIFALLPEQKELLLADFEKAQQMMAELEKVSVEKKAVYEKALVEFKELEKKAQETEGMVAKKQAQLAAYNANRKVQKLAQDYRMSRGKLLMFYAVAAALEKRKLQDAEMEEAKTHLADAKKAQEALAKQLVKAEVAKEKAVKRLAEIPKELEDVKAKLAKNEEELAKGGNFLTKGKLKTAIAYEKNKIGRLEKEVVKNTKVIEGQKMMLMEKTGLDVAIAVIEGKEAVTGEKPATEKPTTEKPVAEEPTTEEPTTEEPTTEEPTTEEPVEEEE